MFCFLSLFPTFFFTCIPYPSLPLVATPWSAQGFPILSMSETLLIHHPSVKLVFSEPVSSVFRFFSTRCAVGFPPWFRFFFDPPMFPRPPPLSPIDLQIPIYPDRPAFPHFSALTPPLSLPFPPAHGVLEADLPIFRAADPNLVA